MIEASKKNGTTVVVETRKVLADEQGWSHQNQTSRSKCLLVYIYQTGMNKRPKYDPQPIPATGLNSRPSPDPSSVLKYTPSAFPSVAPRVSPLFASVQPRQLTPVTVPQPPSGSSKNLIEVKKQSPPTIKRQTSWNKDAVQTGPALDPFAYALALRTKDGFHISKRPSSDLEGSIGNVQKKAKMTRRVSWKPDESLVAIKLIESRERVLLQRLIEKRDVLVANLCDSGDYGRGNFPINSRPRRTCHGNQTDLRAVRLVLSSALVLIRRFLIPR